MSFPNSDEPEYHGHSHGDGTEPHSHDGSEPHEHSHKEAEISAQKDQILKQHNASLYAKSLGSLDAHPPMSIKPQTLVMSM